MNVFSTNNDTPTPNVTPLCVIDRDQHTPQSAADKTAADFRLRKAGTRALHIRNAFPGLLAGVTPLQFVTKGVDVAGQSVWFSEYWGRLADAGAVPDSLILDEESEVGLKTWEMTDPVKAMGPVFADEKVKAALPWDIRSLAAKNFDNSNYNAANPIGTWWNTYVDMRLAEQMTKIIDPANIFGHKIPISSYGYFRRDRQLADLNGWPLLVPGDCLGNVSAPVLYFWGTGARYAGNPNPAWAEFIDNLNTLRSCVNAGGAVQPWLSYPDFMSGDRRMWRALVLHVRATGIETITFWNPIEHMDGHVGIQFADSIFAEAASITPVKRKWEMIAAEAKSVVTGPITTTIDDVMRKAAA